MKQMRKRGFSLWKLWNLKWITKKMKIIHAQIMLVYKIISIISNKGTKQLMKYFIKCGVIFIFNII
jgi:hypothetical protein